MRDGAQLLASHGGWITVHCSVRILGFEGIESTRRVVFMLAPAFDLTRVAPKVQSCSQELINTSTHSVALGEQGSRVWIAGRWVR